MKKLLISLAYLGFSIAASAHDFAVTQNGQKLYFNITDKSKQTAEVTYGGSIDSNTPKVYGNIEIPEKVQYEQKVYTITAIGKKAFCNASGLISITFPASVTQVNDFAFEGCTGLKNVVFSSLQIKFGQGTFFRCTAVEHLTFGSDWTHIDLAIFRWSDQLQEVTIPAKVTKLYNVKKLKGLKRITVDANNSQYMGIDGIVYSKDEKALLSCPRSYMGMVKVADGTEAVKIGALADCVNVTQVDLPRSMSVISFREFNRMSNLQNITLRAETPMTTARKGAADVLIFQVANPNVKIVVPKQSVKAYKTAFAKEEGEYLEKSAKATTPYQVLGTELINLKNIIGVKTL